MLQTDTTMVTKMSTPNQAVQTNPEVPEALTAPVVLEVPMVPEAPGGSRRTWQQPPQRARLLVGIHESVAQGFHFVK